MEDGADLVVFPELSLTGYFLKDQTFEVARALDAPEFARLAELSRDVSIVAGRVSDYSSRSVVKVRGKPCSAPMSVAMRALVSATSRV